MTNVEHHDAGDGIDALLADVLARIDAAVEQPVMASDELVDRARQTRPAGRSLLSPPQPDSLAAIHGRVAAAAESFVRGLSGVDLARPTRLGHDVRTILAHLVGQLERGVTVLEAEAAPARPADEAGPVYDHWDWTSEHRQRFANASAGELANALADVNARIVTLLDGIALLALGSAGDPTSLATRLLARTFELWMHADDVRLALGQSTTTPDPATLLALCELAALLLPYGMAATGNARPGRSVRIVLIGPGGGTWSCPGAAGETVAAIPDAVLVADAATFCRLFHQQVGPSDVPLAVEGAPDLIDAVLAGAQAFAENT